MPEPRVTKAQVSAAFARLAGALDARIAEPAWGITDPRRDGAWILDHSPVYGGYEVRAIIESTPGYHGPHGEHHIPTYSAERLIFSGGRRTAREFVEWINGALDVMRVADELALAGEQVSS